MTDDFECPNHHPIDGRVGIICTLWGNVSQCKCGLKTLEPEIKAIYEQDYFEDGEVYHVYKRLVPLLCKSCGAYSVVIFVHCQPIEISQSMYDDEKVKGMMPYGFTGN